MNALLFLYREILHMDIDDQLNAVRAKRPIRLPTVMSKEETRKVLGTLYGIHKIMAMILYGSGLRLMECLRLRVKNIDFQTNQMNIGP